MPKEILEITFNFSMSKSEIEKGLGLIATPIANVPGLIWKIWLMNETRKEAGGIYLFDDRSSAQKYLDGEIAAGLKTHPVLSNVSVRQFEIIENLTKVTRGPVELVRAKV
ncbi:MAG: YdhR family protein [Nitrososphaerales archaeon]